MKANPVRHLLVRIMVLAIVSVVILAAVFALLVLNERRQGYRVHFPDKSVLWAGAACWDCQGSANDGNQPEAIENLVVRSAIVDFRQRYGPLRNPPSVLLTNRISEQAAGLLEQARFCPAMIESTALHGARISAGTELIFSLQSYEQDPLAEYYLDDPSDSGAELVPCTGYDAKLAEPLLREAFGLSP